MSLRVSVVALAAGLLTACGTSSDAEDSSYETFTLKGTVHVGILIMDGLYISELTAPYDVYKHAGDDFDIEVHLIAQTNEPITTYYGARIYPDNTFEDHPDLNVLVIPSGYYSGPGDWDGAGDDLDNDALIDWVRIQAEKVDIVTSHCWGAFPLAKAGVLDGRKVTTFPGYFSDLREMFPDIETVVEDRRFVQDGNIVTSNGGIAAFEASLHVIAMIYGEDEARHIADDLVFHSSNLKHALDPEDFEPAKPPEQELPETDDVTNVGILIMDELYVNEATIPFDVYKHAGDAMNVFFVAESSEPITTHYGMRIEPHYTFDDHPDIDVLVVPSGLNSIVGDYDWATGLDVMNDVRMSWIAEVASKAEWVTSHCWGSFQLAGAGVLDGKTVTTFPGYWKDLRAAYPEIGEVREDVRCVRDGNIVTSAGGLAAFEASLYVLENILGEANAGSVARGLVFAEGNFESASDISLAD